jgi:hypothetical protein
MNPKYVIFDDGKFQVRNIGGENVYYVKKGRYWSIIDTEKYASAEGEKSKVVALSIPALLVGFVLGATFIYLKD